MMSHQKNRSSDNDNDSQDDIASRLVPGDSEDRGHHLNKMKSRRWSISLSLPAAGLSQPEEETGKENGKNSGRGRMETDSLLSIPIQKTKREGRQEGLNVDNDDHDEMNITVSMSTEVSPEKKRLNNLPSPEVVSKLSSKPKKKGLSRVVA